MKDKYYVKAIMVTRVVGYAVYRDEDGHPREHQRYVAPAYDVEVALHLANQWRDDANKE